MLKSNYKPLFYTLIKPKPITIPAVSVLNTLSPNRANIKPLSIIFDLSDSDQPPSGHTHSPIWEYNSISRNLTVFPVVSSTICLMGSQLIQGAD